MPHDPKYAGMISHKSTDISTYQFSKCKESKWKLERDPQQCTQKHAVDVLMATFGMSLGHTVISIHCNGLNGPKLKGQSAICMFKPMCDIWSSGCTNLGTLSLTYVSGLTSTCRLFRLKTSLNCTGYSKPWTKHHSVLPGHELWTKAMVRFCQVLCPVTLLYHADKLPAVSWSCCHFLSHSNSRN